ncbi:hypothetical protein [Homoserinibacter sp. GY 40078]|uniref:hypothetical protein n=1 Tax=Homoserinibacter sp. GY 40078 TaxID=2603275 RepID=UPI0011C7CAC4|nr:hypothetical protein [Homoserinibacter sp. GY 40078]TXK19796.1 hypothetical protein FVQ89_08030 [Homoserinibacter sp. GY 40078]
MSKRNIISGVALSAVALGLVLTPAVSASAAPIDCKVTKAVISKVDGRARATGYGDCRPNYDGSWFTATLKTEVFHNYDFVPDAGVTTGWTNKKITTKSYTWIGHTQRCDNATVADYFAKATVGISTKTSDTKRIATCKGTGG